MNNILNYKGYTAKIEFNAEDRVIFGKIEGISDLVTFESLSSDGIIEEFHNAVDDYLSYCAQKGKNPDKPYKGIFNVRISPELHKKAALQAIKNGITLNGLVNDAIQFYISDGKTSFVINNFYEATKNNSLNSNFELSSLDLFDTNLIKNYN